MSDIIANFIEIQRKLSFPFSSHLNRELSLDEFFDKFYVEPPISVTTRHGNSVLDWHSDASHKVAIIGSMGAGKSTYLIHQFRQAQAHRGHDSVFLRDFQFFVDHETILDSYIATQSTKIIFVDSLDETVPEQMEARFEAIVKKLLQLKNIVIACRAPFFSELFGQELQTELDAIVQLNPYKVEEQERIINHFVDALDTICGTETNAGLAVEIARHCRGAAKIGDPLSATPLVSALCALAGVRQVKPHTLAGVTDLYRNFTDAIAKRIFSTADDGIKLLGKAAWAIEEARRRQTLLRLAEVNHLTNERSISNILAYHNLGGEDIVTGFRHRTFAEFLIAYYAASEIQSDPSGNTISRVLSPLFNYETTYFLKNLIGLYGDCRILNAIRDFAVQNVGENNGDESICACHNALYLFAACDKQALPTLSQAVEKHQRELEVIHPLVFGTLLSALLSHGEEVKSLILTDALEKTERFRIRNMNYHLSYYGDADHTTASSLLKPIRPGCSWDVTREVLLRRLRNLDEKRQSFRAYDLMTLRHFLGATGYRFTPAESKELSQIGRQVSGASNTASLLNRRAKAEFEILSTRHLVILIHGIRTHAFWYDRLKKILEVDVGVRVLGAKYGRLDLFSFMGPNRWRQVPINKVQKKIQAPIDTANRLGQKITVIAHSNGTQIATSLLRRNPTFKIDNLIMCGSVVDENFDWVSVKDNVRERIVNDYGTRDVWPAIARSFTWGYGYSGTVGFGAPVDDRLHIAGHSDYFKDTFISRYWLPLVTDGTFVQSPCLPSDDVGRPWWFGFFEIRWRWPAALISAAVVLWTLVCFLKWVLGFY